MSPQSPRSANHLIATLQIPYLLSLAGIIADYLPAFPFIEGPTIRLVDKLDQAFANLLSQRRDSMASIAVEGHHYLVSVTDRVRIRSVIESTRIIAVKVSAERSAFAYVQDDSESFTNTDYQNSTTADHNRHNRDLLDMSISTMYERSLSILGDSLG